MQREHRGVPASCERLASSTLIEARPTKRCCSTAVQVIGHDLDAMTRDNTKARRIGYWLTTALLGLVLLGSGAADLIAPPELVDFMTSLGYPRYLLPLLGVAKLLAFVAIFAPKFPRLKEWAYAGVAFNMIGASYSHIMSDDPIGNVLLPIGILAIAMTSWELRPADRRLRDNRPD
jgi:DoxX-like family